MCQTKYASAVPKNLGLGLNFRLFPLWASVVRDCVKSFNLIKNMFRITRIKGAFSGKNILNLF